MLHHIVSWVDDDVFELHVVVSHDEAYARAQYASAKEADSTATFVSYDMPCFDRPKHEVVVPGAVMRETATFIYGEKVFRCNEGSGK